MAQVDSNKGGGDFISNLGRIYTLYTGGFFAFVVVLAILEQMGVPNKFIGYGFVFLTIAVYAIIGIISRTAEVGEYYVAGRRVPAFYNGMATGADWMSGASFVGMAGTLFLLGYDGLAFVLGWTGGYVLVAILIAPFLRKFGAFTVPDFFAERFGGNFARFLAVIVLVCCSFTYVTAQIYATGIIASRFLGMDFTVAVYVGLLGILLCSMLGGMKAVTWTQVAQYIVLIVAYLLPVVVLSTQKYGIPIPQLTYGQALQDITALEQSMVSSGLADAATLKPHIKPFVTYDPLNFFALIFCLMVGTASLPHILMRYFTTPSVREARKSVAWSLFFIFLLYFTAPAYAAFAKLEVYSDVVGRDLDSIREWLFNYGAIGLIKVCGVDAVNLEAVKAACSNIAGHPGVLRLQDLTINPDVIVLSTPEIAGMPYVIAGLVAAGGLAAALSTADGLLLAIANALSHDIYYKMIDRNAPTFRRLLVARILLVIVAVFAAYTASTKPADILSMVAWAFSLAAAGIFPALVLGIWWKRATTTGAVLGMIFGFGICLYYLVGTRYFAPGFYEMWSFLSNATPDQIAKFAQLQAACASDAAQCAAFDKHAQSIANWWGVRNISCALFGLPIGFLTIWIVSLFTPAPSQRIQDMVDATRQASGEAIIRDKDALNLPH
ncbi:Na+/solute symporter (Ssf family) protein [Candidatus Filomicrobium marinum]|uniref:Na+/solute symporter (Ssf family) protein n=1 Tax=Candidatus Filomicrobium marinum TaxID=1608628 RepID=A0A0D6JEZ7_9HYPH|nr:MULTISPECIES: sodium:solute symporter family protein [Filomicrobium]MCV0370348.1 cation acetate symporter [Filomicrobium sp.]CFX21610.1 Na+/solute symporter (Ssf family) protein [Candidatus Filomicrobium marinum]CPR18804.1 Na+/solute symporter (Ssf family) protein [Candidatus Filomicrobium marinum]